MKNLLILGAGRSSSSLISYLINQSKDNGWLVTVGDISLDAAGERVSGEPSIKAIQFDIKDHDRSFSAIKDASVVVSLLPADFHPIVARHCLEARSHLVTASYVSSHMAELDGEAKKYNLTFLNECGLDPGIDHMSAMQIIDKIKSQDANLVSFESFAGGLIAPETDPDNPWRYKFSWNPRNIVMAGQGVARFREEGHPKFISYQQLFGRTTSVTVPGYGEFEGYANRDSTKYLQAYGLNDIKTIIRGTLRYKGFCNTWNVLVQLGCCDDSYTIQKIDKMTHREFVNLFLPYSDAEYVEHKIASRFGLDIQGEELSRLQWSGFFDKEIIGLSEGTPAQITEHILNKRWKLAPDDKDMIVMWHRFIYEKEGKPRTLQASLVVKGDNSVHTAMAKTVGLPLGIAAKLILTEKVSERGVIIPVYRDIYEPVLAELKNLGIEMYEEITQN